MESISLPEPLLQLLKEGIPAILATQGADGWPYPVITWAIARDAHAIRFGVDIGSTTFANLQREHRATLQVIGPSNLLFLIKGTVRLLKERIKAFPFPSLALMEMAPGELKELSWPGVEVSPLSFHWTGPGAEAAAAAERALLAEMREWQAEDGGMALPGKIRILLADDHAVLRAGLRALINAEPDMEVVGEAADGEEAVARAQELLPDVIVMDIAMPRLNGLEATRRIVQMGLPCRILVLTIHHEQEYLLQVLEAGGLGYVTKASADQELMEAIRTVHRGNVFLYPSATRLLLEHYLQTGRGAEDEAYSRLSEREKEVLKLTAEGYSNQEIGDRLFISPKTVDTYRSRIMEKLNLQHRADLVKYALRKGILKP